MDLMSQRWTFDPKDSDFAAFKFSPQKNKCFFQIKVLKVGHGGAYL
jgi:hypothetical protein